ncbi:MAG: hypothetical protein AYK18_13870 [Theionarchaea archaeon DG-70]|nr:MAG: hypothetical protein AYK18_13870 [Theionarchaea archaeon DG-70]
MNEKNSTQKLKPIKQLETMYKEHWEHSRHCEKEMFWFTNIYVAIVTAIFYFIRNTGGSHQTDFGPILMLALYGLILSVFGFMIVIALSLGHHNYIMNIVTICYRWDVMEFYANPGKPVFLKRVFRYLYEITSALFGALLLFYVFRAWTFLAVFRGYLIWLLMLFAIIIIFAALEGLLYRRKWSKHVTERKDFVKTLRNDTGGIYRKEWDIWFKKPEYWKEITHNARARGII